MDDIDDLFKTIKDKHLFNMDWFGFKYFGINLDWDYNDREVKLSMKEYVERALKQFYIKLLKNSMQDPHNMYHQNMVRKYNKIQRMHHQNWLHYKGIISKQSAVNSYMMDNL